MTHADWTCIKDIRYPTMQETVHLRNYFNTTGSPVTVDPQNHSYNLVSTCSGSSSQIPPWTSYFSSLFSTTDTWSGTSTGTVSAGYTRFWDLKFSNDGGEQKWYNALASPTAHERTRINRHSPYIHSYEVQGNQTGGTGG